MIRPYYDEDGITIYHGDCREIIPQLPKVDLVLTDPPYGIGEAARNPADRIRPTSDWANPYPSTHIPSSWDDSPAPKEIIDFCANNSAIIWGGNYFNLPPSPTWFVWDKKTTGDFADCELAWSNVGGAVRKFEWLWSGYKKERPEDRFHPTQKPIALMKWCLGFCPDAQTILDPFMGSGTTLRAAKDLGLKAIGIEIEERYCEIAARRLSQGVLDFGNAGGGK